MIERTLEHHNHLQIYFDLIFPGMAHHDLGIENVWLDGRVLCGRFSDLLLLCTAKKANETPRLLETTLEILAQKSVQNWVDCRIRVGQ